MKGTLHRAVRACSICREVELCMPRQHAVMCAHLPSSLHLAIGGLREPFTFTFCLSGFCVIPTLQIMPLLSGLHVPRLSGLHMAAAEPRRSA